MFRPLIFGLFSLLFFFTAPAQTTPVYKDAKQPLEKRVADLLKRMTLEEKVVQLQSGHAGRPKLDDALFGNPKKLDSIYGKGASMLNPAFDETMEQTIARRNRLQQYLRTKTRLGIPAIFIDEAHHGLVQRHVDVFPHGIGMACSWDTSLMRQIYGFIANQARSRGTSMVLSPVVDIVRDPRWGRTGECWGEDPFLNGAIGTAVVRGFQGGLPLTPSKGGGNETRIAPGHVAATLKHYTGHGQPESGNNTGPVNLSERTLREYHMEPFRLVIREAQPAAIMASYNEVMEIPSHANRWLLKDVLRKEWKYRGLVVSDWFAIDQLIQKHHFADNNKDAALKAFTAGVEIDLPYGINYKYLSALVKEGKIPMAAIDSAVAKVLRLKFQMGLFEEGDIDLQKALDFNKKTEGRKMALKIAEESMVLLKNGPLTPGPSPRGGEGGRKILPIEKNQYKRIAVIGPMGNINLLGDYSGQPSQNISILKGLQNKGVQVSYAPGVRLTLNGDSISQNNYQFIDSLILPTREENEKLIAEAVMLANASDFVVLAIGENEQFSREAWTNHFGDMVTLDLQSQQEELVKAIHATGKPYVVYLMHGRPLSINWIAKYAPAIIDGWFMGEEAGNAFANILFGEVNPSGKLTVSVPRSAGQVPITYNRKPTSQYYEYATEKNTPLFPFGHGLSYTRYIYDKAKLNGRTVSVNITNAGTYAGDEIVQLYIHQKTGESVVRPIKELKGFRRISLAPGETKTVEFSITDEMLKHWTASMKFQVEPGDYEIMIGTSSESVQKVLLTIQK